MRELALLPITTEAKLYPIFAHFGFILGLVHSLLLLAVCIHLQEVLWAHLSDLGEKGIGGLRSKGSIIDMASLKKFRGVIKSLLSLQVPSLAE
jgi:hypothetical protein